jgi:hypothetical protein
VALDGFTKCDLDVVKVDLEVTLGLITIFIKRIEELRQQV